MATIKLSHDLGDLSDRKNKILVMKDKGVLDDSDDEDGVEVENVEMAESEKIDANKRQAKHGKSFNPYEDDWEEGMLSKYDDFDDQERSRKKSRTVKLQLGKEIESKKLGHFPQESGTSFEYNPTDEFPSTVTIGGSVSHSMRIPTRNDEQMLRLQSDFLTREEAAIPFRKSNSKKKKREKELDEEDDMVGISEGMTVEFHETAEEDEELYAQLLRLRRMEKGKIDLSNEEALAQVVSYRDQVSSGFADFLSRIVPIQADETHIDTSLTIDAHPERVVMKEESPTASPPTTTATTTAEVRIDSGLASALQLFSSRGELKPDKEQNREEAQDAKQAFRKLTEKFNHRRQHHKRYKESKS